MSNYDKANIGSILAGEGSWFTAYLIRLISKADEQNLARLKVAFPEEVDAVKSYRINASVCVLRDRQGN